MNDLTINYTACIVTIKVVVHEGGGGGGGGGGVIAMQMLVPSYCMGIAAISPRSSLSMYRVPTSNTCTFSLRMSLPTPQHSWFPGGHNVLHCVRTLRLLVLDPLIAASERMLHAATLEMLHAATLEMLHAATLP